MRISITEAEEVLSELVKLAEAGEKILLTRDGHAVVRLLPVREAEDRQRLGALLECARASAAAKATPGPSAARSQDFLFGDDGLPE